VIVKARTGELKRQNGGEVDHRSGLGSIRQLPGRA
jgi:hypothetical protein